MTRRSPAATPKRARSAHASISSQASGAPSSPCRGAPVLSRSSERITPTGRNVIFAVFMPLLPTRRTRLEHYPVVDRRGCAYSPLNRGPGSMSSRLALVTVMISVLAVPVTPRADEPPPIDVGLEESVKTELVLLDGFVLNHDGNAVPDLTRDDFELTVNGRETSLVSVDSACRPTEEKVTGKPKVVLLFDYQHLRMPERA